MRKIVILCDRCGKEISDTFKVIYNYNRLLAVEGDKKYSDICTSCAGQVMWFMYYRAPTPAQLYNESQEEKKSTNTANLEVSSTSN